MKKLILTALCCAALTGAAGAAHVGTIDNGYPGDTEAQAQMLCDLGLLQGTEKGFELEKPMTRAEAAAMLTRLLGAEQAALEGDWEHPFTDVPQWADGYVGWLYENGLTNGTAETTYSAEADVTCGQYCTFLARASTDYDYYGWLLSYGENEEERCNAAGFVRGDAVSLSARLLRETYRKNGDEQGRSVAQVLIDKGVFTAAQLRDAADGVLPHFYTWAGEGKDTELQYTVAGVAISSIKVGEDAHLCMPNREEYPVYLVTGAYGEEETLCRIEMDPMRLVPLYTGGSGVSISDLCRIGDTDYFELSVRSEDGLETMSVLTVQGDTAQLTGITLEGEWHLRPWTDGQLLLGMTQGWLLTEDRVQPMEIHGRVFTERADGVLVTQSVTAERTEICTWTADGQPIDSVTVPNSGLAYPGTDEWTRVTYAPALEAYNDVYLWGSAGLYREADGRLTQITALPVYDYSYDPSDGSYVIVTHAAGRFVEYAESAVVYRTGDTLARILPDGTAQPLLPELPEGSLLLDTVNMLPDGRIEFTHMTPTEPRLMGRFTCVLADGRVTVTGATNDIYYMLGEDAPAREQARLDALGIGAGAGDAA